MPHCFSGESELRITSGYPFTTAHMDSLVDSVFSDPIAAIDGIKIRSTFFFTRSRICPCTSFAGKQTVSEVTALKPSSNILCVLGDEI